MVKKKAPAKKKVVKPAAAKKAVKKVAAKPAVRKSAPAKKAIAAKPRAAEKIVAPAVPAKAVVKTDCCGGGVWKKIAIFLLGVIIGAGAIMAAAYHHKQNKMQHVQNRMERFDAMFIDGCLDVSRIRGQERLDRMRARGLDVDGCITREQFFQNREGARPEGRPERAGRPERSGRPEGRQGGRPEGRGPRGPRQQ